jgi:hypothetical protein
VTRRKPPAEKLEIGPKARPITLAQILAWADAWHAETGQWPTRKAGPVPCAGLTWRAVHEALKAGWRGLPGGDTLAKFLGRERGASGHRSLGDLAVETGDKQLAGATLEAVSEPAFANH